MRIVDGTTHSISASQCWIWQAHYTLLVERRNFPATPPEPPSSLGFSKDLSTEHTSRCCSAGLCNFSRKAHVSKLFFLCVFSPSHGTGTPFLNRISPRTNFHGRSCSLIFRSRIGSLVSKKIPSLRFSPGSCPKAPASPPVLFVNEYQKPPVLPRFSSQMPPVLPRFFWAPPVLPRFPPGSPHTLRQPRKLVSPRTCARRQMRWQKKNPMPWQNHTFSGPRPFLAPYALAKKHLRGRAGFFPPTIVLAKKHLRRRASFSRVTPKAGRKKSSAGKKTPSPHIMCCCTWCKPGWNFKQYHAALHCTPSEFKAKMSGSNSFARCSAMIVAPMQVTWAARVHSYQKKSMSVNRLFFNKRKSAENHISGYPVLKEENHDKRYQFRAPVSCKWSDLAPKMLASLEWRPYNRLIRNWSCLGVGCRSPKVLDRPRSSMGLRSPKVLDCSFLYIFVMYIIETATRKSQSVVSVILADGTQKSQSVGLLISVSTEVPKCWIGHPRWDSEVPKCWIAHPYPSSPLKH